MSATPAQQEAYRYNLARGYDDKFVYSARVELGCLPAVGWQMQDYSYICAWQRKQKLKTDGKIGPKTRAKLLISTQEDEKVRAPLAGARTVDVGLWWDIGERDTISNLSNYTAKLCTLGISFLPIMITASELQRGAPRWKWTPAGLKKFTHALTEAGISPVFDVWAFPQREFLKHLVVGLRDRLSVSHCTGLESDAEGNFRERHVLGYESLPLAADAYFEAMQELAAEFALELSLTSYPNHAEFGKNPLLTRRMGTGVPQAYSRENDGIAAYAVGGIYAPGAMQAHSLKRAMAAAKHVICGMAAWDQEGFKGLTPYEAMDLAKCKAVALGCTVLCYWSAKWVLGKYRRAYAFNYISSIR